MKPPLAFALLAAFAAICSAAFADEPVPGIAGFQRIPLPGNSDTILSVPFVRPAAAAGVLKTIAANQITLQGTPGWQSSQFVYAAGTQSDTYHVRFTSGAKEGAVYTITANDASSLTLDLDGDTLDGAAAGDTLSIQPYWTLGTLFPNGNGVNTTLSPSTRLTEVLFPDFNATGINASAAHIFFFYNGHWHEIGKPGTEFSDDVVLYPDAHFIVRQNTSTGTELICPGQVITGKVLVWLGVNTDSARDNYVALPRPMDGTLGSSGLVSSGAFQASPSPSGRTDELLVYDNTAIAKNKSPSAIYYYWNGAWRKVGSGATSFDTEPVFKTGSGFIIRKAAAATTAPWVNPATY